MTDGMNYQKYQEDEKEYVESLDMKEKQPPVEEVKFDEAPASVTVKIKSPAGFEYMFTMRSDKASTLMFRMKAMEENWTKSGFTPIAQNVYSKKEAKPVEYVPNRVCPT